MTGWPFATPSKTRVQAPLLRSWSEPNESMAQHLAWGRVGPWGHAGLGGLRRVFLWPWGLDVTNWSLKKSYGKSTVESSVDIP